MPTRTRRPCLGTHGHPCPHLAPPGRSRCDECQRQLWRDQTATRPPRPHYHGDWPAISRTVRRWHLATHGPHCPGHHRPPHPTPPHTLTVDHLHPTTLAHGVQVLCRACNASKRERTNENEQQLELETQLDINGTTINVMRPAPARE